jgi:[ribosomal protein S5]-alanine N-acetyltransferase
MRRRLPPGRREAEEVSVGRVVVPHHGGVSITRLGTLYDAPVLADVLRVSRDFLAPWEPVRSDDYFTASGQLAVIRDVLGRHAKGAALPHVILDGSGRVAGRITLSGIVRGPFQSCSVGYWVSVTAAGRGLATAAVRDMVRVAFDELRLHRVQAETLLHNVRSQRVLNRNGFRRIGMAPAYLNIAGRWQDHILYQVINDEGLTERQADNNGCLPDSEDTGDRGSLPGRAPRPGSHYA